MMKKYAYLDNNATTPVAPEVRAAMLPFLGESFGNPSSIHSAGREARKALDSARDAVAAILGVDAAEIVFTSGGTEANNAAIIGMAARLPAGRRHIVTTQVEHPSILEACRYLEKSGYTITYLPVERDGTLTMTVVEEALTDAIGLVTIMSANNETGVIFPVDAIARVARSRGILVHTDAVQAVGKIPVSPRAGGIDALSLSAHKIYGPKGSGALFVAAGVPCDPILRGGSHENKRRAGTENMPGIAGLGAACTLAASRMGEDAARARALKEQLVKGLTAAIEGIVINGSRGPSLPNTVNLSFPGCEGESLLLNLDLENVAVSTGAACSSGSLRPSHVLTAMGLPREVAQGSLRFSLGRMTTEEDIQRVVELLPGIVERIQGLKSGRPRVRDGGLPRADSGR